MTRKEAQESLKIRLQIRRTLGIRPALTSDWKHLHEHGKRIEIKKLRNRLKRLEECTK